jgi:tetratricopeptide (TPR) repeat protein
MTVHPAKHVTVFLNTERVVEDPYFFPIPGQSPGLEDIQSVLLAKFQTNHGSLSVHPDREKITVQWRPDYIDANAEQLHAEALRLAKARKFEDAVERWKQAASINEQDVDYLFHVGLVYFELKRYAESVAALESVISICPIHYKAHLLLGINCIKIRRFDLAETHVSNCIRLNQTNLMAYLNLGAVLSIQKRYNDAIDTFNRAVQLSPKESRAYLGLARVYAQMGDTETANGYFRKVIELSPDSPLAAVAKKSIQQPENAVTRTVAPDGQLDLMMRGMGSYLSGHYKDSSERYKEYLSGQPSDDYGWYLLGEAQIRLNRVPESVDCFQKAIRLNAKRGLYHKALGMALFLQKKHEESAESMKKAVELGKKDPMTLGIIGADFAQMKKNEEAIQALRASLKKNPNNPLCMFQYANILMQLNERKKAIAVLEKINLLEYFTPIKEQSKKLLAQIK